MMAGLGVILSKREALELTLVRSVGLPYQEITKNGLEKEIVNYFKLDLQNQGFDPIKVEFSNEEKNIRLISPALPMLLNAGENKRIDFFIQFPLTKLSQGSGSYSLNIFSVNLEKNKSIRKVQELPLVGPLH